MEVGHQGRRICREMSPDRAKMCVQTRAMKPTFKKVQVVYYLSRNGHLQHPHYIEVTHLSHHQLRLKDVLDRLTVLRGKGMPLLYSWSCKRSYKNGYVWNDLAQSDFIFPSEGGEYVLKGSELLEDCNEKLHHLQLQVGNVQQFQHQDPNFFQKRRISASKQQIEDQEMMNDHHADEENAEEDEEYQEKTTHTTCSRGVSTDEIEELKQKGSNKSTSHTELNLDTNSLSSPPSTASSTLSDNPNNELAKRFEDGDPIGNEPMLSRNSMLFSLIACGGSGSFRKAVLPQGVVAPSPPTPPPCTAGRKSCSGSSLHKGVVCKAAAAKMAAEEDRVMINFMSENPRFGNLLAEEKEYFSGSIVESITNDHERIGANEPSLKKSSSYNQERCAKAGLGEEAEEEEVKKEKGLKGKCIPRKKKSSSKQPKK
ncbi:hypothetical protein C2S53_005681 [Perilla frutescens var. hirtella]|uniref:SOSEKI DIX-like domain-containing protein n=1 Tax=Perilla frutescens var. hirtella TaxID=608512 RepID=A0AAD4IVR9_PERFH|nr:hypothetical protein C2S53_005681 [Perilla frutescens var. hirtella]